MEKQKKEDEEKERVRKRKEQEEAEVAKAAEEERKKVSRERALKVSGPLPRINSESNSPSGVQEEQGHSEGAAGRTRRGEYRNRSGFLGKN